MTALRHPTIASGFRSSVWKSAAPDHPSPPACPPGLAYIVFDILQWGVTDLRTAPYLERHAVLRELAPLLPSGILISELYRDGEALWDWVQDADWEGVVSKRLSAPYKEGKYHRDWFKKKTALLLDVDIVGLKIRNDIAASLVMSVDGQYFGSVSLGLTGEMKALLTSQLVPDDAFVGSGRQAGADMPFPTLPPDLKKERILWLDTAHSLHRHWAGNYGRRSVAPSQADGIRSPRRMTRPRMTQPRRIILVPSKEGHGDGDSKELQK